MIQGVARPSGQDELQPEGNGTGFLWDKLGNVVTNYHVLQSALASMGRRPGGQRAAQDKPVVAKITLLGMYHCLQVISNAASMKPGHTSSSLVVSRASLSRPTTWAV